MQVSQERLNQDYLPLQMATFEFKSFGRGRCNWLWQKNVGGKGHWVLLLALRTKLRRLLAKVDMMVSGYEKTEPSVLGMSVSSSSQLRTAPWTLKSSRTAAVQKLVPSSLSISSARLGRE